MTESQAQTLIQGGHPLVLTCRICGDTKPLLSFGSYRPRGRPLVDTKCLDCHNSYMRRRREARLREGLLADETISYRKMRMEVLSAYGGEPPRCSCCAEWRVEFLSIDHINGGGGEHRRELGANAHRSIYRDLRLKGFPLGFRVLCHNCNQAEGLYGYCPHQQPRTREEWLTRRPTLTRGGTGET